MSTSRVEFQDFSSSASSDDDDAPREISVSTSRQQGISQIKTIQDSIRRSKEDEKEKRRHRNEKFKVQKEKKLTELSKRKLPEHVLAAVSAKTAKKITQEVQASADKAEDEDEDDDIIDEDVNSGHEDDDQSDSGVDTDSHILSGDYIPLGSTSGLALVTPEVANKKSQEAVQQVLSFKHNRLYNQSNIPRENAKQRRAKMAKRKAVQMAR